MQRYFASNVNKEQIFLLESDIYHATKVMRNVVGDLLIAVYQERLYHGQIVSINPFIVKNLGEIDEVNRELNKPVTLFYTLAKGDKIDFVIQKATELGVSKIVLIKSERCVVKLDNDDFLRKLDRYTKIAKEAAEQSLRRIIPQILGIYDINKIDKSLLADVNYVAYELSSFENINFSEASKAKSVSILIGPEGGLSQKEVSSLFEQGFKTVSLGKRILRTETAAIAALSMINMEIEK